MNQNLETMQLLVDHNLKENYTHGTKEFPLQYYVDELHKYPGTRIPLHWHPEAEIYVARGCQVDVQIENEVIKVAEGNGIIINPNTLHGYDMPGDYEGKKSMHPNIVYSSDILADQKTILYKNYISQVMDNSEIPYILLDRNEDWHTEILGLLDQVFSLLQKYSSCSDIYGDFPQLEFRHKDKESVCFELDVQILLLQVWKKLYENRLLIPHHQVEKRKQFAQIRMQKMLLFIQENFSKKVTLEDIAFSANISRSEALRCFQYYMNISPLKYVNNYRMEQAKRRLITTDQTVIKIATDCGFYSASHFSKIFRNEENKTPLQYRKEKTARIMR